MTHEESEGSEGTVGKEEQTPFRELRGTTGLILSYKHLPALPPMLKTTPLVLYNDRMHSQLEESMV